LTPIAVSSGYLFGNPSNFTGVPSVAPIGGEGFAGNFQQGATVTTGIHELTGFHLIENEQNGLC
jgi:hypothetical protein